MGKRLDSYKLRWYRKQKKSHSVANSGGGAGSNAGSATSTGNNLTGNSSLLSPPYSVGAAGVSHVTGNIYGVDNSLNMSNFNNNFNVFHPNLAAAATINNGNNTMALSSLASTSSSLGNNPQQPPKTGVKYIDNVMSNLYSIYPTNSQMRPYRAYNAKNWSNIIPPGTIIIFINILQSYSL